MGIFGDADLPLYFERYRKPSVLLPGIRDTVLNIFRDIEYLGKLIMGIFARS